MSKRDIIIFLFKWKYSIIGYFVFIVALVTTLLYALPKSYPATARVVIESNLAPVMHSSPAPGRVDAIGVIYTEVEIILSTTVLASAVDQLKPYEREGVTNAWKEFKASARAHLENLGLLEPMSPREEWIRRLQKFVEVEPIESSAVINIVYRDDNPDWAARIVNAVVDSYIAQHLKIYSSPGTVEVYRRQIARLEKELTEARKVLENFKRKTSATAIVDRKRSMVEVQSRLMGDLNKARGELSELLTKYEPGHKNVTLVNGKIESINASLAQTQSGLQELELQETQIQEMEHAIASAEQSHREYQRRYEDARLNELGNPDVVNVRVMEYSEVPTRPAHSRLFYIAISVVGGLILSFSIALLREYFDHRVADPDMAERLLGVPVLGSVERI